MNFIKKFGFELIMLIFVGVVMFFQLENYDELGWYFITLIGFLFFLSLFSYFRSALMSILKDVKYSLFSKNYVTSSVWVKGIILLSLGLFSAFIFAVAELFSYLLIISESKPSHLGVPLKFYPLEGQFLIIPFLVDGFCFSILLFLSSKLKHFSRGK